MKSINQINAVQNKIVLKSGKDQSVRRFHPWIFSGAIKKIYGNPVNGDIVEVYDNKDQFLALGHYQTGTIAVRILSFENVIPDRDFFYKKISSAVEYRKKLGLFNNTETNVFRLIYAEGDYLSGLIADYYNRMVVIQMHSAGMYKIRDEIAKIIAEILEDNVVAIYDRSDATLPEWLEVKNGNGFLKGDAKEIIVSENGYKFIVDWKTGQKTGFFIDQRENRALVQRYSDTMEVLNLFGYTGGFSVYAMKNARKVDTVDSSSAALKLADENIRLNYGDDNRHSSYQADAFEFLKECKGKYDLIILDPPAFAKHNDALPNALLGYKRLNMRAIEAIRTGGIIFTFSCSQVVSRENFRKSIFAAAANTGRKVRILHNLGQPADHPVNIFHPESEYLKGFVLYVE